MEEFIVNDDIYDKNGTLVLSKGRKILLDDKNKMLLSKHGILDKVLNMKQDEEVNFSNLSAQKREEVQHNQERRDGKDIEINQLVLKKITHSIASKLPTLDNQYLRKATDVTAEVIYCFRDQSWYSHFRVITNHVDWLYAHSINAAIISAVIGVHLGYSENRLIELVLGALLHDVGMVVLPSTILNKPSKLSDVEMSIVQNHSEMGYAMLKDTELTEISKKIILQHHERNDGSGYPDGITSKDILEEAKIVMIAESFDTATSYRPYKETISAKMVLDQMMGSPHLYEERFVKILKEMLL